MLRGSRVVWVSILLLFVAFGAVASEELDCGGASVSRKFILQDLESLAKSDGAKEVSYIYRHLVEPMRPPMEVPGHLALVEKGSVMGHVGESLLEAGEAFGLMATKEQSDPSLLLQRYRKHCSADKRDDHAVLAGGVEVAQVQIRTSKGKLYLSSVQTSFKPASIDGADIYSAEMKAFLKEVEGQLEPGETYSDMVIFHTHPYLDGISPNDYFYTSQFSEISRLKTRMVVFSRYKGELVQMSTQWMCDGYPCKEGDVGELMLTTVDHQKSI